MKILEARINALVIVGTNYVFSKTYCGDTEAERKHHNLAEENFEK